MHAGKREGPLKKTLQLYRQKLAVVTPVPRGPSGSIDMDIPQIEASVDVDSPTEAVASAATKESNEEEGGQEGGEASAGAVGQVGTENLEDEVMEAAEQLEVPRTSVERLRVELHGLLEGVVEQAFDSIRGSHLRRKQLRQLIDRAETPQASLNPIPCS